MLPRPFPWLYAIIDCSEGDFPLSYFEKLLCAKLALIQLRDKSSSAEARLLAVLPRVIELRDKLAHDTKIILNDFVDLALSFPVDGVHIGQEDCKPLLAREKLGPKRILGFSTHSLQQVNAAPIEALDYIACGPVFCSPTKHGHAPELGLPLLKQLAAASALPVVAIGGITSSNAELVYQTGAACVAIVSDLARSENLKKTVDAYELAFHNSRAMGAIQ